MNARRLKSSSLISWKKPKGLLFVVILVLSFQAQSSDVERARLSLADSAILWTSRVQYSCSTVWIPPSHVVMVTVILKEVRETHTPNFLLRYDVIGFWNIVDTLCHIVFIVPVLYSAIVLCANAPHIHVQSTCVNIFHYVTMHHFISFIRQIIHKHK